MLVVDLYQKRQLAISASWCNFKLCAEELVLATHSYNKFLDFIVYEFFLGFSTVHTFIDISGWARFRQGHGEWGVNVKLLVHEFLNLFRFEIEPP